MQRHMTLRITWVHMQEIWHNKGIARKVKREYSVSRQER